MSWTRAHRSVEVIRSLAPAQRYIAEANAAADELAKFAVGLHPPIPPRHLQEAEAAVAASQVVLRLACAVMPLFSVAGFGKREVEPPPVPHPDAAPARRRLRAKTRPLEATTPHIWLNDQCDVCMVGVGACWGSGCSGVPPIVAENAARGLCHSIQRLHVSCDPRPLYFCCRCGSHGRWKYRGLHQRCREVQPNAGAMNRVRRGMSPDAAHAKVPLEFASLPVAFGDG